MKMLKRIKKVTVRDRMTSDVRKELMVENIIKIREGKLR